MFFLITIVKALLVNRKRLIYIMSIPKLLSIYTKFIDVLHFHEAVLNYTATANVFFYSIKAWVT